MRILARLAHEHKISEGIEKVKKLAFYESFFANFFFLSYN